MAADRPAPRGALLLSAFGLGWFPHAPGSLASFATFALIVVAQSAFSAGPLAAGVLFAYGVVTTLLLGDVRAATGRKDPSWIVSDEVAGQSLACAGAVFFRIGPAWLAAFLLFRLLDVAKPGPVRRAEALPGGAGVLCDDLIAGAVAGVVAAGVGLLFRALG